MDKESNIGWWDKRGMWLENHRPGRSRHSLTGATYDLKDVSPFAMDMSGRPQFRGLTIFMGSIGAYLIYWFWLGSVYTGGDVDPALLYTMNMVAQIGGFMFALILSAMLIDLHKGSFTPYIKIIELRLRSLLRKPLKRVELKVKSYVELYNPVIGGYWRSLPEYEKEIEEEGDFEPVDLDDEEMPYALLEGKMLHSIRDMAQIMEMALGKGEVVQTKDEIKEILKLKRRFVDLAEKIRLPFYCTLCECDSKGGKVYPLFISEHSLFGGSGELAEFKDHCLAQRTWAGLMSKDNVRASVGEGIEIGMYKFYELVPDEFALLGKKEEKMKFAPVIFVTASDAQAEKIMNDFRYNATREGVVQQDLIDASVIHDSSVADDLFEMIKLTTARLKRKEKSEDEIRKDSVFDSKDMVHKGLEKVLLTERAGKPSMFGRINLFSNRSVKYLFYIISVIAIALLIGYFIHYYGGIRLDWLFSDIPGNETVTNPDWGAPLWKPLLEWIK
jgi:hypothetical protein